MGSQIREVVRLLNEPPFNKNYSLVAFDEQQPHQLMLLINEILGEIDASQRKDMTREDPVMAQNRILFFLHGLAYRPDVPETFATLLFNGDRDVCYKLLEWLLKSIDDHKKRAYLAPFLTEIEIPQDLFQDEMVMEIKQSCSQLKEEFIHSHKQLALLEEATQDPQAKKEIIQNLDDERRQLLERVSRLEKKLQGGLPNFEDMALACQRLKRELEDEKALKTRLKDQKELLAQAQRSHDQAQQRLEKIRGEQGRLLHGDAVTMLGKLQEDVVAKRKQAQEEFPRQLAELRSKREDMKQIINGTSYSEQDLEQLRNTQRRLEQDAERINREKDAPPAGDDKIVMFRQQASMIERKKQTTKFSLDEHRELKTQMEKQIEEKELSFDSMGDGGHLKPDDFRRIKQDVRAKSTQHKRMKSELNQLQAEKGVVQRTVAILESRCKDHEGWVREQERMAGVEGATENLEQLEKVSSQKAEFDRRKGLTIEEHAREVEKVRLKIKEKKQKLAPMIKELRAERGKFQMLDAEYTAKKEAYESRKLKFESDFLGLESFSDECRVEIQKNESTFHFRQCQVSIDRAKVAMCDEEVRARTGELMIGPNQEYPSYRDMFTDRINAQSHQVKQLRQNKAYLQDNFDSNAAQFTMFTSLQTILNNKLMVAQQGGFGTEGDLAGGANLVLGDEKGGVANVFTLS